VEYTADGRQLVFATDSGVFSKNRVDFGSDLLIKSVIAEGVSGKVLDLGCGYGAVGISLYTHNPGIWLMMADVNERAVDLCRRNAGMNIGSDMSGAGTDITREDGSIDIILSDGFTDIDERYPDILQFDYILLNPPVRAGKGVVFRLYAECEEHLVAGGRLYVVIRKKQGMESSFKELTRLFDNCSIIEKKSGYAVLCSVRKEEAEYNKPDRSKDLSNG